MLLRPWKVGVVSRGSGTVYKIQHPLEVIPADAVCLGDDLLARFHGSGSTCRFHRKRTAAGRGAFPPEEGGRAQ